MQNERVTFMAPLEHVACCAIRTRVTAYTWLGDICSGKASRTSSNPSDFGHFMPNREKSDAQHSCVPPRPITAVHFPSRSFLRPWNRRAAASATTARSGGAARWRRRGSRTVKSTTIRRETMLWIRKSRREGQMETAVPIISRRIVDPKRWNIQNLNFLCFLWNIQNLIARNQRHWGFSILRFAGQIWQKIGAACLLEVAGKTY